MVCKYFLLFCKLYFPFLKTFFNETKKFDFEEIQFFFSFVVVLLDVIARNPLPNPRSGRCVPMFSSKNLMVLAPIFRLVNFELMLYTMWDQGPTSFFSMWISRCPRTICWRDYSLPTEWSQQPCWKLTIGWPSLAFSVPPGTSPSSFERNTPLCSSNISCL